MAYLEKIFNMEESQAFSKWPKILIGDQRKYSDGPSSGLKRGKFWIA